MSVFFSNTESKLQRPSRLSSEPVWCVLVTVAEGSERRPFCYSFHFCYLHMPRFNTGARPDPSWTPLPFSECAVRAGGVCAPCVQSLWKPEEGVSWIPRGLEFQIVVRHHGCLAIKPRLSKRSARALNHEPCPSFTTLAHKPSVMPLKTHINQPKPHDKSLRWAF